MRGYPHTPAVQQQPTWQPGVTIVDGTPIPSVNPKAVAVLAQPWTENVHRPITSESR